MFKIFPASLIGTQKVPLITGWREKATCDPIQIQQWYEQFGERITFYGIPCGEINGILALDIDIKTNGWDTIKQHGFVIPETLHQKTLNGGSHFIFKFDPNRDLGNRVGFLPGLDIRSSGGWIAHYGFNDSPIADAPEWLYEAASRPKVSTATVTSTNVRVGPEIAEGILAEALAAIRSAPAGESNDLLNREAFKVGQLVACQGLSRQHAETELYKAAIDRGKGDYEAKATIKSGLDGGAKHPMTVPFPSEAPIVNITIPPAPEAPGRWTPRHMTRFDLMNTSKLRKPQLFKDWSTEDIQITTADGGTGKTTMKLLEAICLALGERFLGFDCLQPGGKTLFITGEDTAEKLAAMLGAILNQMGILDDTAKVDTVLSSIVIKKDSDLCLITKDKMGFLLPNSLATEKVLQAIEDFKPKMIIFDPISSFWGSESALNDMNKAVTRFMSSIAEKGVCVEMINHMGKSSSANKDVTQFAGRGGSGLPSNSRVARVLHSLTDVDYRDLTGEDLVDGQTAMTCHINKFSDGSPLLNKPLVIIRNGYLFSRQTLSPVKEKELANTISEKDKIFTWVKELRSQNKYPSKSNVISHFMSTSTPLSKDKIERAINDLAFHGHMGEKFKIVDSPDETVNTKVIIIVDSEDGREA